MKKLFLISILFVAGGFFVSVDSVSAALNCGSYGTQYFNTNPFPPSPGGCPTAKPVRNDKAVSSAGYHCCMTPAKSAELDADYAAANGNGGPTPAPSSPTPTPAPGGPTPTPAPGGPTPTPNPGGASAGSPVAIEYANPLQYGTVEEVFTSVISVAQTIVVLLALVFLVIGALLYITSGGNDKRIGAAKACITAALIGLVIIMVAPSFLKEIAGVLGWSDVPAAASGAPTITEIATKVLNFLLSIIGIIAIIMFLVGSVMYLTSAGDEKRVATGKSIVKAAIIGMIVAFSALVIVRQLADFFIT